MAKAPPAAVPLAARMAKRIMSLPPVQAALRHPAGLWGAVAGHFMAQANPPTLKDALGKAGLKRTDKVLEVGFGDGAGLEAALQHVDKVYGVDMSESMCEKAKARLANEVAAGRAEIYHGVVEKMDKIPSGSIDLAFHLNCIYFWNPIDGGLKELTRVLRPGGTLLTLTKFQTARGMDPSIFINTTPEKIMEGLKRCGYVDITFKKVDLGNPRYSYQAFTAKTPA
eukprot:comp20592_c0_seq1/m.26526 comp20592_c0_seq1/g.26526  ORF comp20592_c0_seq1/g.26526 comp20592_c0_seq1/m.26526 type:complete len:225 (-) comp20592_c0_seq1:407-1081(-)